MEQSGTDSETNKEGLKELSCSFSFYRLRLISSGNALSNSVVNIGDLGTSCSRALLRHYPVSSCFC
jgi:hypothetical protein